MTTPVSSLKSLMQRLFAKWLVRYRDDRQRARLLAWNGRLDTFMNKDRTFKARLAIRESFDDAFASAGFEPIDVWRSGQEFFEDGERVDGTRVFQDPLSGRSIRVCIQLWATYTGSLECSLVAHTREEDLRDVFVYTTPLFKERAVGLPTMDQQPWGVVKAFTAALEHALGAEGYPERIRSACQAIRRQLDDALTP